MINAHIEMDLNDHIVIVAAKIIEELCSSDAELVFESLMRKFLKRYNQYTPDQFMDAVVFLYMIDGVAIDSFKVVLNRV